MKHTAILTRSVLSAAVVAALAVGCASTTNTNAVGNNRQQLLTVPADEVNQLSLKYYAEQNTQARAKNQLITSGPEYTRVANIMRRMTPQVGVFRADAVKWPWELVLINEDVVNAHVMAGGKITFYTGLIRKLKLTDDEIAAVMGHEISHALREHTREKMSQQQATGAVLAIGGALLGVSEGTMQMAGLAKQLGVDLPFSRSMESEADEYGVELAARAGYNPQAAVTLWDKMAAQGGSSGPSLLSTHPAPTDRKQVLANLIPKMMPLYEAARKR